MTLTAAAPLTGTSVALSSSNTTVVQVPSFVTVPAGATSASFTMFTSSVTASTAVTISASFGGTTRTATLTVNPVQTTNDTVAVQLAEYDSGKRELRVEATSSNSGAVLRCLRDFDRRAHRDAGERRRRQVQGPVLLALEPAERHGAQQPRRLRDEDGGREVARTAISVRTTSA